MEIFKNKKKKAERTAKLVAPDIQIMMMGARRVGKTSMLASMYNSFSNVSAGTNLIMSKKGGVAIDQALAHMKALFNKQHMVNETVPGVSDFKQTQGFDKIDFQLTIAGKKSIKPKVIRFVDCEGEWFNSKTKEDDIGAEIEKSEAVIIAVDTVLLMEENGAYNDELNAVQSVTEAIINYMNPDALLNNKKMVLFVPMKCEKYFHQNSDTKSIFYQKRMQAITDRIKEKYAQLFNFLTSPNNKKYFTVGILPVITIGGIEFDGFTSENVTTTDSIQYRYCEPDRFEPKFCDRPLIYSLLFVKKKIEDNYYSKAFNANNGHKRFRASVKEFFQDRSNIAKDTDYINELEEVIGKLSPEDYPGSLIQDPEAIEMKAEIRKKG